MKKTFLLSIGFAFAMFAQDPATTPQSTTQGQSTPSATTGQSTTTKARMRRSTTTTTSSTSAMDATTNGARTSSPAATTNGMRSSTPAATTTGAANTTSGSTRITERQSTMVPRNKGDQRSDVSYSTVDQKGHTVDGTTKVKSKKDAYKVTQTPPPRDKATNP